MEISETDLAKRLTQGTATICRVCFDMKKKINLLGFERNGQKVLRHSVCEECYKAIYECQTCQKNRH